MPECLIGSQPAVRFQLMTSVRSWSIGPSAFDNVTSRRRRGRGTLRS
jgi:hypothetical protein